jgi:hypothetical protein
MASRWPPEMLPGKLNLCRSRHHLWMSIIAAEALQSADREFDLILLCRNLEQFSRQIESDELAGN